MNSTVLEIFAEYEREIQTYKSFMYFNGLVAFLTNTLAIFMILYKSPVQMKVYKWYLLNITLWSATLDIYLSLLYQPYLMYPTVGVCAQGIFKIIENKGFHIFLFQLHNFLMGAMGVSIIMAFFYRWAAVTHTTYFMHSSRGLTIIVLIHILYSSPIAIPSLFAALYDQQVVENDTKERFPIIYEFTKSHGCMFVSTKATPILTTGFLCIAIVIFMISGAICTALIYIILYKIRKEKYIMSSRTYSMEKQLLISLATQFFIPTTSIAIPFLLQINLIIHNDLDSKLGRKMGALFFVFATWHSSLNALCMLILTKPYRTAIIKWLFGCILTKRSTPIFITNDRSSFNLATNRNSSFTRTLVQQV